MEPVIEDDPTPSGEIPELPEPVQDIASEFKSLAAEIRKRQVEDAAAAQTRQTELKEMYRKGRRSGIIWGVLVSLLLGGTLVFFTVQQNQNNDELTGAVSDLAASNLRKTPVLDHIACHEKKSDTYMVTLGYFLLDQIDGFDDPAKRREFEAAIVDLNNSTDPNHPDACPVAPQGGD